MSVGQQPTTRGQIDGQAGALVKELENVFTRISEFKVWLDATPDATMQASPYNTPAYTGGEVAIIKSAYADLAQLITIYRGTANLTVAKDFTAFAKQLIGFGAHL